jgi:hypothetical protein
MGIAINTKNEQTRNSPKYLKKQILLLSPKTTSIATICMRCVAKIPLGLSLATSYQVTRLLHVTTLYRNFEVAGLEHSKTVVIRRFLKNLDKSWAMIPSVNITQKGPDLEIDNSQISLSHYALVLARWSNSERHTFT